MTIWYIYDKTTGVFMGSGTPYFDTDDLGSTEIPSPPYIEMPPVFNGAAWETRE